MITLLQHHLLVDNHIRLLFLFWKMEGVSFTFYYLSYLSKQDNLPFKFFTPQYRNLINNPVRNRWERMLFFILLISTRGCVIFSDVLFFEVLRTITVLLQA